MQRLTIIGNDILNAKTFLDTGDIVAIPTETVYGLAANALNPDAVLKIFTAKNRPQFDPLIVHVSNRAEIEKYVTEIPEIANDLITAFMPGPLTLLLPKKENIPDIVTSGLSNVAIRIPAHPLALKLLKELDYPLAAPSANPFGYVSPTTAVHVFDQLQEKVPYILDGGPTTVGVESTIVGFEGSKLIVFRLGGISVEEIEDVTGKYVEVRTNTGSNPTTPGSLLSHYAPRKPLHIISDQQIKFAANTGAIVFDKFIDGIDQANQMMVSPNSDLQEAAKNLFAAIRTLDASDVDSIVAVEFPEEGLGRAINDRLRRAAFRA